MTTGNTLNNESRLFANEDELLLLTGILDVLIPASTDGVRPAAGALGISDFLVKRANREPDTHSLLRQALTEAQALVNDSDIPFVNMSADARNTLVRKLETRAPLCFAALLRHTYMGYYSRADVRAALGLSPQATQPHGYAVPLEPPDEMAKLTRPVTERGRCYRVC